MAQAPMIAPVQQTSLGIIMVLMATMIIAVQDSTGKFLVATYSVFLVAWGRYFFSTVVMLLLFSRDHPFQLMRSKHPFIQLARGSCVVCATLSLIHALSVVPLADAVAIAFIAPFIVTILSIFVLGEQVGWRRMTAIIVGLAGVLFVIKPGFESFQPEALLVLICAFCFSCYQIMTRMISHDEDPRTSLLWSSIVGTVILTAMLVVTWEPIALPHWPFFVFMGACGVLSHFLMIKALGYAPASLLQPYFYAQMLWVVLIGWLIFGELPDALSWLGIAIIVSAGLYVWWRERVRASD